MTVTPPAGDRLACDELDGEDGMDGPVAATAGIVIARRRHVRHVQREGGGTLAEA